MRGYNKEDYSEQAKGELRCSTSVTTRKVNVPELKVHEAGIVDEVEFKKPLDLNDALT